MACSNLDFRNKNMKLKIEYKAPIIGIILLGVKIES